MRGVIAVPVLAVLTAVSLVSARAEQDPPPQLPPVFRGDVNVIRLDVSVLDKNRRPVTGLTADDFTVIEDGVPQRIAAVSEIIVADRDPTPTAWMRTVGPDIATNDLADQLGDGRPYAIVMDDWNISSTDQFLVFNARAAARQVIARLGASDVAAVIYVHQTGKSVDFTTDRAKLLDAIDRFEGREPPLPEVPRDRRPLNPVIPRTPATPWAPGGFGGATGGADMPVRASELLSRSKCERKEDEKPVVPALEVVAGRLSLIPNRRKTIVFVSVGMTLMYVPGCQAAYFLEMNHVYGLAEQANINIYSVDVADDRNFGASVVSESREFLEKVATLTGGLVVGGDGMEVDAAVERIFSEAGSYYLVGYEPSNGAPDGKLRRIDVKVKRPDVTVRNRSGRLAPDGSDLAEAERKTAARDPMAMSSLLTGMTMGGEARAPGSSDLALSGMNNVAGLPLRASVVPFGIAAGAAGRQDVAVALSVRLPAASGPVPETLTLVRSIYDPRGRPGPPVQQKVALTLTPGGGDELRYDVFQRLTLTPGRYEMRLNAMSAAIDRGGSVFIPFEVPDVARAPVGLSGIVLGTRPPPDVPRTDVLASTLPIVPTSARYFSASDNIVAFFHIFQGSAVSVAPVTLKVVILDRRDQSVVETSETIGPDAFGANRAAAQQIALPLSRLTTGPYLLTITATRPEGATSRREVVFRVR